MSTDERGREILHQMIIMKEMMQKEYRDLVDIVNDPEADSREKLRALKKQARLAVKQFKLSVEIAYVARMLGYGVKKTSSGQFNEDNDVKLK